jgi:pyruvate formate lyase activating enzyme
MIKPTRTRRDFLETAAKGGILTGTCMLLAAHPWLRHMLSPIDLSSIGLSPIGDAQAAGDPLAELIRGAPLARYWISTDGPMAGSCGACHEDEAVSPRMRASHPGSLIRCQLCARNCMLREGDRGLCRARVNVNGELRSLVYGRPITIHVDPIEKKPFYHFLPGAAAYSLATSGCPLRCKFCQNWEISQSRPEDYAQTPVSPKQVAEAAVERGAPVIAFTYNEPTVFIEYLTDIARAGRPLGRKSVLVSCGYMTEAPLKEMCEVLDAIKVDLKGFSETFYNEVSEAELKPVLRSIRQIARSGTHLEIVNLMVPSLNDSEELVTDLTEWIAGELGPDVPLHFTRFHPDYQLTNMPPTPIRTLERAREIAMARGIRYCYVGNAPGHPGNHTYCPGCGKTVIEREGFLVSAINLKDGCCARCGTHIPGVWQ